MKGLATMQHSWLVLQHSCLGPDGQLQVLLLGSYAQKSGEMF